MPFFSFRFVSFHFLGVSINIITCFEMDFKKKVPLHNGKLYYENKFVDSLFSITQPKSHDYTRVCVCLWCRYILLSSHGLYLFRNRKYKHFWTWWKWLINWTKGKPMHRLERKRRRSKRKKKTKWNVCWLVGRAAVSVQIKNAWVQFDSMRLWARVYVRVQCLITLQICSYSRQCVCAWIRIKDIV